MPSKLHKMLATAILASFVGAPFLYGVCFSRWWQGFYYTGCGGTLQYAGEYLRACEPIDNYENDQQDGDWLVESVGDCLVVGGNCVQDSSYSVAYYKKCNGSGVSASESDFSNGNCHCP